MFVGRSGGTSSLERMKECSHAKAPHWNMLISMVCGFMHSLFHFHIHTVSTLHVYVTQLCRLHVNVVAHSFAQVIGKHCADSNK